MGNNNKGFEKQKTQNNTFESFAFVELKSFDKEYELINIFKQKGFFEKGLLNKYNFRDFLTQTFQNKNLDFYELDGASFQNNTFIFHFKNGKKVEVAYRELEQFLLKKVLKTEKKEDIERRVSDLNKAIEAIYSSNQGIFFDSEIDDEDRVTDKLIRNYALDKNLKGLNLKELKARLDSENSKLFMIYDITQESHKKQELLKKEITFYAGVGDKYEGGAFVFGMSTNEIRKKVYELCDTMSLEEIFYYIKTVNEQIDDNLRRSDMVDQLNLKLINSLYEYTFNKLKKENSSNEDFIKFIKIITGRGKLKIGSNEKYEEKKEFSYESLDVDELFKAQNIANKALIHIMYREGGLLEEIKKKKQKEVKLEDKELDGKTPSQILQDAKNLFNDSVSYKIPGYGEEILNNLGFTKDLAKSYDKLSFDEKVSIGSLARILKELKKLNHNQIKDPNVLQELSKRLVKESFEDLNESFSDNFNETLFDWNGISAEDLGLEGVSAEIFELYQDINGNEGLFDWKDTNELGLGAIATGITLVAAIVILGPVLSGGAVAYSTSVGISAGIKLGLASWGSSQIFSRKGYDTYKEGFYDVGSQLLIELGTSTIMTAGGLGVLKKTGLGFNPDLFFSKAAWGKAGFIDKGFMGAEALGNMYLSSLVSSKIKKDNIEHHKDTDEKK